MKLTCLSVSNSIVFIYEKQWASFKADNIFLYFVCFVSSCEPMFNFWEMHPRRHHVGSLLDAELELGVPR